MADSKIYNDDILVSPDQVISKFSGSSLADRDSEELSLLRRVMDHEGIRYLYLTGRYGAGKKTLAFEYAKRYSDDYDCIIKISAEPFNIMVNFRDGEEFNLSDIEDGRSIIRRYWTFLQILSEKGRKWLVIIYDYTYIPTNHEPNIRQFVANYQITYQPDFEGGNFSGGGSGSFIIIPSLDYSIKDRISSYRYGWYSENSAFHVEAQEINIDYHQTDKRDRSHGLTFLYRLKNLTPEYASELLLKTSGSDDISAAEKLVTDDYIGCLPLMIERTGEYVVYNRITLDDVITEIDSKNFPLFKMTQLKTLDQFADAYGLSEYYDFMVKIGFDTLENFEYSEIGDFKGNDIIYYSAGDEIIKYQAEKSTSFADQIININRYTVKSSDNEYWRILVALSVTGSSFRLEDCKSFVPKISEMIDLSLLQITDGLVRVYPLIQNIINTSLTDDEYARVPYILGKLGLGQVSVKSSSKR